MRVNGWSQRISPRKRQDQFGDFNRFDKIGWNKIKVDATFELENLKCDGQHCHDNYVVLYWVLKSKLK